MPTEQQLLLPLITNYYPYTRTSLLSSLSSLSSRTIIPIHVLTLITLSGVKAVWNGDFHWFGGKTRQPINIIQNILALSSHTSVSTYPEESLTKVFLNFSCWNPRPSYTLVLVLFLLFQISTWEDYLEGIFSSWCFCCQQRCCLLDNVGISYGLHVGLNCTWQIKCKISHTVDSNYILCSIDISDLAVRW